MRGTFEPPRLMAPGTRNASKLVPTDPHKPALLVTTSGTTGERAQIRSSYGGNAVYPPLKKLPKWRPSVQKAFSQKTPAATEL
jgi:hypothetical protein